jgi:hypothetical protein
MTTLPKSPKIQRILAEAKALTAALKLAEGTGSTALVHQLVAEALDGHNPTDSPTELVNAAMRHILGRPIPTSSETEGGSLEDNIFGVIARAWVAWATGLDRERAHEALRKIPIPKGPLKEGGALHLMAMQPWAQAVDALLQNDLDEARRMFRRATELSSQCGTVTNAAVQWTYAASLLR